MSLELRFRIARGDFRLEVDLELPERGVSAIFGPSASGKTTLLRAVAGLDRHAGAVVRVGSTTWQDEATFVPPHRRGVGYVFQEPSLFDHLTVRGNVEYALARAPEAERRASRERAIRRLGLEPLLDRSPDELSGGERQRVALARALASSPRLLLLDEPLAALDTPRRRELLPYLDGLADELGAPMLYVSHAADEVARLADHLVLVDGGRVVASGPVHELATRLDLPLATGEEAEALVEATVVGHDDADHLTRLEFPGGELLVARATLAVGVRTRLRIAARDVSLALERPRGTSILNVLRATVVGLAPAGKGQVVVRLDAGGIALLARVTKRSEAALAIVPGLELWAQVKGVAIVAGEGGRPE